MSALPIFSEGEIAFLGQGFAAAAMQDTAYVLEDLTGNGAVADFTVTPQTAAGVPCRVQPFFSYRAGKESLRGARDEYISYWQIWLDTSVTIGVTNRIRANGADYRVLDVTTGQTFGAVNRCLCAKVL
jgi:hypothetical protein